MKSTISKYFLFLIVAICLFSCKKSLPQLPSNKTVEVVRSEANLLDINKKLTVKEDSLLQVLALEMGNSFEKSELGFWFRIDKKTDGEELKTKESYTIHYKLMFTDRNVILEENKDLTIGKKQVVTGLEEGLKLLRKGEKATFIIPWYLAYGMNGLENLIPPYTSLVCEVNVMD